MVRTAVGPIFCPLDESTFFLLVASGYEDSGCRVSSWVSACVILTGNFTSGTIASLACSSISGTGEVLVDLTVPSAVSWRAFFCFSSVSLITHLEKGMGRDAAVFKLVPTAVNEGYNDCCSTPGITS